MPKEALTQFLPLIGMFLLVYFLMIRPQKKKEKDIKEMRNSMQEGDEIVTIGGLLGKVIKVKEDIVIIEIGAEKTKIEITKWAVSSITKKKDIKSAEEN